MGWPGDCLARGSGFRCAKARSGIPSRAGRCGAPALQCGFVKAVEKQLRAGSLCLGCSPSSESGEGNRKARICHMGLWRCKGKGCERV